MLKLRKLFLSVIGVGVVATAIPISLTACKPIYVILRDTDYSNQTIIDDQDSEIVTSQNSRIIDATNTKYYHCDYEFQWNSDSELIPTPLRISTGTELSHLVLFAGEFAYTIKVKASMEYEEHIYSTSITVNVKATPPSE